MTPWGKEGRGGEEAGCWGEGVEIPFFGRYYHPLDLKKYPPFTDFAKFYKPTSVINTSPSPAIRHESVGFSG